MEQLLNQNRKLSLALGVLMAVLVGFSLPAKAGNDSETEKKTLSMEDQEFFEEYFSRDSGAAEASHTYVIYGIDGELIYKTTLELNQKDQKLQEYLLSSDPIMHFDNISYLVLEN